jgi:hypothetical protein
MRDIMTVLLMRLCALARMLEGVFKGPLEALKVSLLFTMAGFAFSLPLPFRIWDGSRADTTRVEVLRPVLFSSVPHCRIQVIWLHLLFRTWADAMQTQLLGWKVSSHVISFFTTQQNSSFLASSSFPYSHSFP